MTSSIDFSKLTEKVNYSKKLHEFYHVALRCMVEKFHVERFCDHFNFDSRFPNIPIHILEDMRKGVTPRYEHVLLADTTHLDAMVWEISFLLGTVLGIMNLTDSEEDQEYVSWLQQPPSEGDMLSRWGFASLALAHELPPSKDLVLQLFPLNPDQEQTAKGIILITEINQIPYIRFIRELAKAEDLEADK